MHFRRIATIALTALAALSLSPVAQAQEKEAFPRHPVQLMTPEHPDFWNFNNRSTRILSPYGTQNVECRAFYGQYWDCLQNGQRLGRLESPLLQSRGIAVLVHPNYNLSSGLSSR